MKTNVNPNEYYSANSVVMMGVLPWKSAMTFNKKLNDPYWISVFNPVVDQKEKVRRYYIKGENIIKFIELAETGKLDNGTITQDPI